MQLLRRSNIGVMIVVRSVSTLLHLFDDRIARAIDPYVDKRRRIQCESMTGLNFIHPTTHYITHVGSLCMDLRVSVGRGDMGGADGY